ncbi:MAG: excinuclease ABC subunit UvrA [bacterium]
MTEKISIKGARVHNLKSIDIEIPKNKLVCITGLSGSGKSSLAFDTIYAEGQRRYAESLSSYARQFMEVRKKPDVDKIDGLSPTIAIDQKSCSQNPRSTVGTVTEVYDYMRLLYARVGIRHCPDCKVPIMSMTAGQIVEEIKKKKRQASELSVFAPLLRNERTENGHLLQRVEKSGFNKVRIDGRIFRIHDLKNFKFDKLKKYNVDLFIGLINDIRRQNVMELVEKSIELSNGLVKIVGNSKEDVFSTIGLCSNCGRLMPTIDVRNFSFNSPSGACCRCSGLGITKEVQTDLIIPNKRLSIAEGAIQPWTRITGRQSKNQKLLSIIAEQVGFSIHEPISSFGSDVLDIVFYGTGGKRYEIDGKKVEFKGVVSDLTEKYLTTDSDYVRKEVEQYMVESVCPQCNGKRLKKESIFVKINDKSISELALMDIEELSIFLNGFHGKKPTNKKACKLKSQSCTTSDKIAEPIIKEIIERLKSLSKVGLGYLTADRSMNTLSGGEVTRVRLATQLTTGLNGVVYVLDEPSVGLHPKDNGQLIDTLKKLRDLGNTIIVVEHDADMMKAADYLIDVGPGAGANGGKIVAVGTMAQIKKNKGSLTGDYLSGRSSLEKDFDGKPYKASKPLNAKDKSDANFIKLVGASENNLKNINVSIPLGKLVCVTGVSGSGKSTLVIDILGKALAKHFHRAKQEPGKHKEITGLKNIDKVIAIDQSPIGRTPRSNPATYTNVFTGVRDLYANLQESKMYNYKAGKFSFNVKGGGRCESCAGEGYIRIPMQFLDDVFVECPDCSGTRYSAEVLEVHYRNKNIADVLDMTVDQAYMFFNDIQTISCKLNILRDVGLGYIRLGQPATTLSGGEAQRIKLATELARASTGKTLYILDEPTTGLHFEDIKKLLLVLRRLVEKGNTVVIIEHNVDVIKNADWIIDLGPGGGRNGGEIVGFGTPEKIAGIKNSWTGKFIR